LGLGLFTTFFDFGPWPFRVHYFWAFLSANLLFSNLHTFFPNICIMAFQWFGPWPLYFQYSENQKQSSPNKITVGSQHFINSTKQDIKLPSLA
jgi:hypothetical protein